MAHFTRTQTDATWTTGNYVTLAADWQSLNAKVFAAINGDNGGTWAPSSLLTLEGTYPTQRILLTGPLVVDYGGSLNVAPADATAVFRLAADDWPKFSAAHALRMRTIVTPCMVRQSTPLWHWCNDLVYGGVQSIACTVQRQPFSVDYLTSAIFGAPVGPGTNAPPIDPIVVFHRGKAKPVGLYQPSFTLPLRVHDGARLVSATLTFRVPNARSVAPIVPPQMRIIRVDTAGNISELKSTASGADPIGYLPVASPASGAAWFNGGQVQSITYTCDQNQTIDVSQYTYWAEIIEEVGTNTTIPMTKCDGTLVRECKLDVTAVATSNIPLTGTQTVDGVSVGTASAGFGNTQERVLCVGQSDASQNGIWTTAAATTWTRAPDMKAAEDCTPGFVVHAMKGTALAGTVWECKGPTNTQAVNLSAATDLSGTPVSFQRRRPRGNIYHAVSCAFDSIADMRYQ